MAVEKSFQRILIIKMSSLGDVLTALPTLAALRSHFPNAYIAWAIQKQFADVLPGKPYLDEQIFIDRQRIRQPGYWLELRKILHGHHFDLVLDLQMIAKSAVVAAVSGCTERYGYWEAREGSGIVSKAIAGEHKQGHIVERLLDVVRYLGVPVRKIEYPLPDLADEKKSVANKLVAIGVVSDYILLAPGSRGASKNWPIEYWSELAGRIAEDGHNVLIIGAKGDYELAERIITQAPNNKIKNFTGQTTIKELMALEEGALMHISSDTGPLHIANAVGTSLIGLFGPTRPERSGPYGNPKGDVITVKGPPGQDITVKRDDSISMADISVDEVYQLYERKLREEM